MDETYPSAEDVLSEIQSRPSKFFHRFFIVLAVLLVAVLAASFAVFFFEIQPPAEFPSKSFLGVQKGESLGQISIDAENMHIVHSATLLKLAIRLYGGDRHLSYGQYYFESPQSLFTVAAHFANGDFGIEPFKVTLAEGMTREKMAQMLAAELPGFDQAEFLAKTEGKEGFLFPSTYFISPAETGSTSTIVKMLEDAYSETVAPLASDIAASGMSERDVITLASIVEKEAHGDDDRAIVAGILEKRLSIKMALQADATVAYALGKTNQKLSSDDLKYETPYNTYLNRGLPPGPIDNPGRAAMLAVLHPTQTPYLYYLHDANGVAHYAATFSEHKQNIAKYLK